MTNMTPAADQWTVYSAAQNLPAVLNDPNKGKQSNFFVKTWGDSFVEKTEIAKSPFLPDINYSHFELYLRKVARKYKKHTRLSQSKIETNLKVHKSPDLSPNDADLETIPRIYMKSTLPLNDLQTFNTVFPTVGNADTKNHQSGRLLQEQLSHYLDIVEVHIAKQVSLKSSAFFHAMTSHDHVMEQMGSAVKEVRFLRSKIQGVDQMLAKDSLTLLGHARSRGNHMILIDKLRLMSTVLQTQPTLQLLLRSSDYVGALELIASTQEMLARELAGVTSLRHLPSQLKEMSRLIDKMLSTEFEKYAAADLHRPLESPAGLLEPDRLISLVAGLLRQNHLHFLEMYKQEAVTAAQTVLKQLVIEQLAQEESNHEVCLTGSGEVSPTLDPLQWLKVLSSATEALGILVKRVKAVHDVIKQTADISAGIQINSQVSFDGNEKFLTLEEHGRVDVKLRDLLIIVCDYCHERLASLVTTHSDKQLITAVQITELSSIVKSFAELTDQICSRQCPALKAAFKIQAGAYVHRFHSQRKAKLQLLLESERWKIADVPPEFQLLLDRLRSEQIMKSLPGSPVEENDKKEFPQAAATSLKIASEQFVTVGTVLMLLRLICEYCVCAYDLPQLAPTIARNLAELLQTFNSRCSQLVLCAGALRTAGLKTITSTNLTLASRALQLVLMLIPYVRQHFQRLETDSSVVMSRVEREVNQHIQQIKTKVLSIMTSLLNDQLQEWDAKPPVPSQAFRNISRHLAKLHEAVNIVLPNEQVNEIYETVHKTFKERLREQLIRMNIQNNGGPQHGVVTSELIFYLETIKSLKVLGENEISDKGMEDIWVR